MENKMTVTRAALVQGAIFGGILIVYGLIFRLADLDARSPLAWVFYILMPVACYFAMRSLKQVDAGKLPYRRGVGVSALTSVIAAGAYSVYVFLYNRFVDDSLLVNAIALNRQALMDSGLSAAEIEQRMEPVNTLLTPGPFSLLVFVQLTLFGILTALIIAAFIRSKPSKA